MIGEIIKIKGIELLVLDKINGNPFVIALNLDIDTQFSDYSNNYTTSILRQKVDKWIEDSGINTIVREVDLTTMDGYTGKGKFYAAPLTFDEYRKYADIIIPNVKKSFWLCTGWGRPDKEKNWANLSACFVNYDGRPGYTYYNVSYGLAPAFILDRSWISKDLSNFSNKELMDEIARRMMEDNKMTI